MIQEKKQYEHHQPYKDSLACEIYVVFKILKYFIQAGGLQIN